MIQGKLFHSDAETRQVASLICQNRGYRTNVMGAGLYESEGYHVPFLFSVEAPQICGHNKSVLIEHTVWSSRQSMYPARQH